MSPLYEYECVECQNLFDVYHGVYENPVRVCPDCKSPNIAKLIGFPSVILKDVKHKDKSGETIWFPKDGRPYYDNALRRTFNTVEEKKKFMDEHGLVSDGSSDLSSGRMKDELEKARGKAKESIKNKRRRKNASKSRIQRHANVA